MTRRPRPNVANPLRLAMLGASCLSPDEREAAMAAPRAAVRHLHEGLREGLKPLADFVDCLNIAEEVVIRGIVAGAQCELYIAEAQEHIPAVIARLDRPRAEERMLRAAEYQAFTDVLWLAEYQLTKLSKSEYVGIRRRIADRGRAALRGSHGKGVTVHIVGGPQA